MRSASPDCSPAYYLIFLVYPFNGGGGGICPLVLAKLGPHTPVSGTEPGRYVRNPVGRRDLPHPARPVSSGVSPGGRFLTRPRPAGRFDYGQSRAAIYHRLPEQFFVEEIYQGRFDTVLLKNPAQFARLQERLAQYRVIYNEKTYRVLALRPEFKAGAVRPRHTLWRAPMVLVRRQPAHQTMSLDNIDLAP